MKRILIKLPVSAAVLSALLAGVSVSHGALGDWQTLVSGSGAAATVFSPTLGSAPVLTDVGTLTGDRSFEFVVNAGTGGRSQALLGSQLAANGGQGLKYEQWDNTEVYGLTVFGVVDLNSTTTPTFGVDTHVAFVSDGVAGTDLYVNGSLVHSFTGTPLALTGMQGLAGVAATAGGFIDNLDGAVLGFASYDFALSPTQISDHYLALIPEPSSVALLGLAGLGLIGTLIRRRRR